ncbi:MAG: tetratricopeptide repeat protein [Deltaproteobacteria bacterium]|nr:MAG: tetratricopeptide repeat protein [Deltaproteobacteria bacterium]
MIALGSLAIGCVGMGSLPGSDPSLRLTDLGAAGDPARRASLRLCIEGLNLDEQGRDSAALSQYQRAIQVDPTNPYAYLALARHEIDEGDPDRALAYVDQAEALLDAQGALTPGVEAHLSGLRGAALMAQGGSGALHLDRARRLDPHSWGDGHLDAAELR